MYRVECTVHRVQGTEVYSVQSTAFRVQSECRVQSTVFRVQCTEYRVQMYRVHCYRVECTEYRVQSTE